MSQIRTCASILERSVRAAERDFRPRCQCRRLLVKRRFRVLKRLVWISPVERARVTEKTRLGMSRLLERRLRSRIRRCAAHLLQLSAGEG